MMEGWPMYVITITNIDHNLLEVEVSVDVYRFMRIAAARKNARDMSAGNISTGGPLTTACFLNWRRSLWNKPMNV